MDTRKLDLIPTDIKYKLLSTFHLGDAFSFSRCSKEWNKIFEHQIHWVLRLKAIRGYEATLKTDLTLYEFAKKRFQEHLRCSYLQMKSHPYIFSKTYGLRSLDPERKKSFEELPFPAGGIQSFATSRQHSYFAYLTQDKILYIHQINSGKDPQPLPIPSSGVTAMKLCSDAMGQRTIYLGKDDGSLILFRCNPKMKNQKPMQIQFSPSNAKITAIEPVNLLFDNFLFVGTSTGEIHFSQSKEGYQQREKLSTPHKMPISSIGFDPNKSTFYSASRGEKFFVIWKKNQNNKYFATKIPVAKSIQSFGTTCQRNWIFACTEDQELLIWKTNHEKVGAELLYSTYLEGHNRIQEIHYLYNRHWGDTFIIISNTSKVTILSFDPETKKLKPIKQ